MFLFFRTFKLLSHVPWLANTPNVTYASVTACFALELTLKGQIFLLHAYEDHGIEKHRHVLCKLKSKRETQRKGRGRCHILLMVGLFFACIHERHNSMCCSVHAAKPTPPSVTASLLPGASSHSWAYPYVLCWGLSQCSSNALFKSTARIIFNKLNAIFWRLYWYKCWIERNFLFSYYVALPAILLNVY